MRRIAAYDRPVVGWEEGEEVGQDGCDGGGGIKGVIYGGGAGGGGDEGVGCLWEREVSCGEG